MAETLDGRKPFRDGMSAVSTTTRAATPAGDRRHDTLVEGGRHDEAQLLNRPFPPDVSGGIQDLGMVSTDQRMMLAISLQREAASTTSDQRAAMLLYELGRLYEQELDEPDQALAYFRQSHDRSPAFAPNTTALTHALLERRDVVGALGVLDSEVRLAADDNDRAAALTERALIRLRLLGDHEGARADLLQAQQRRPEDSLIAELLAEVYERRGEIDALADLVRQPTFLGDDDAARAAWLSIVARHRALVLADDSGAAALYQLAQRADPENQQTIREQLEIARRLRDEAETVRLTDDLAGLQPGPLAAAMLAETARLAMRRLGNPALALPQLERAAQLDPASDYVFTELAQLYERKGRWPEAAAALTRAIENTTNPIDGVEISLDLARIQIERLNDLEGALITLRAAVERDPNHPATRTLLGRLYARHGRHRDLVDLLADEISRSSDTYRQATAAYRMGDVLERNLGDMPGAAEAYSTALAAMPDYRPAIRGLDRVYAALQRHEDLVAAYEQQLAAAKDLEERLSLLRRIADLWERHLGDPAAALAAYERTLAIAPTNIGAMYALRRIYATGNRWQDLIDISKNEAAQTHDRWRHAALLLEIAEVESEVLQQPDSALENYLRILEDNPTHQPALMAAGRLLRSSGAFDRLIELHRAELAQTSEPQRRSWLLLKIGRVLADELGRAHEAQEALLEAARLADDPSPATDYLARLYRYSGNTERQLQLMMHIRAPAAERSAARHHRRLAQLFIDTDQPARAIEHLRRALAGVEPDTAAFDQLVEIFERAGDQHNLGKLYDHELARSSTTQERLWLLHRVLLHQMRTPHGMQRAVEVCQEILATSPRNQVILHQLANLAARLSIWPELVACLELKREPTVDDDYRAACGIIIAALRDDRLRDLHGAAQGAVELLEKHPTHLEALDLLERYARHHAHTDSLLQVSLRRVKAAENVAEQSAALVSTASIYAHRGDLTSGHDLFRKAVELTPASVSAIRGWRRAAADLGLHADVAQALEMEADALNFLPSRVDCLLQAAQLWEHSVTDVPRARRSYRKAIELQPEHVEAGQELERLLRSDGDYRELIETLRYRHDRSTNPLHRRDLTLHIVAEQLRAFDDLVGARQTIEDELVDLPNDRALLQHKRELARRAGDWDAVVAADRALLGTDTTIAAKREILSEMAQLFERPIGKTDQAIDCYRQLLALGAEDVGVASRLADLLVGHEQWNEAQEALQNLVARDDLSPALRRRHHLNLSHVYAKGTNDRPKAIDACRRALAIDPTDPAATERLADLLEEGQDTQELAAHLESSILVQRQSIAENPLEVACYEELERLLERKREHWAAREVRATLAFVTREATGSRSPAVALASLPALDATFIESALVVAPYRDLLRPLWLAAKPLLRPIFRGQRRRDIRSHRIKKQTHGALAETIGQLERIIGTEIQAEIVEGHPGQIFIEDTLRGRTRLLLSAPTDTPEIGGELRFRIAKLLARVRLQQVLAVRLGPDHLEQAIQAVVAVACEDIASLAPGTGVDALGQRLAKSAHVKRLTVLQPVARRLAARPLQATHWLEWMEESEDRLALVACGDICAALSVVAREESGTSADTAIAPPWTGAHTGARTRQLLTFAVSEDYLSWVGRTRTLST